MSDSNLTDGQQGAQGPNEGNASSPSAKGEVAGSFLLGLVQSFYDLSVLPQGGMALDVERVSYRVHIVIVRNA